jgi:hypothetical protein
MSADKLGGLTEERFSELRDKAQQVITGPGDGGLICAVMIASRRLYSVASDALSELLEDHEDGQLIEEYITGAARQTSEEPFEGMELFTSVSSAALPFLLKETVKAAVNQTDFYKSNGIK